MKIMPRKTITIGTKFWLDNDVEYTIIGQSFQKDYGEDEECWNMSLIHHNGNYSENGILPKNSLIKRLESGRAKILQY